LNLLRVGLKLNFPILVTPLNGCASIRDHWKATEMGIGEDFKTRGMIGNLILLGSKKNEEIILFPCGAAVVVFAIADDLMKEYGLEDEALNLYNNLQVMQICLDAKLRPVYDSLLENIAC